MENPQPDLRMVFVFFGRLLRSEGIVVGPDRVTRFIRSLSHLDPTDLRDLYWAGRSCLIANIEEVEVFDRKFAEFFLGWDADAIHDQMSTMALATELGDSDIEDLRSPDAQRWDTDGLGDESNIGREAGRSASSLDHTQERSLADWTDEELVQLGEVLSRVASSFPTRRARRTRAGMRQDIIDLRRTVHRSLRREGELIDPQWRQRIRRTRPVLILIDVSGSMSSYSRALLHFAYALGASSLRTETFSFGTRLTHLTPLLSGRSPKEAVKTASAAIEDWSGGTRIGENLSTLFKKWADRPGIRGSVVLLFSDGLERGDPEFLGQQMRRLARLAFQVIWLNPLKGDSDYLPLARGMRAALPHVKLLVPADSADDLLDLCHRVSGLVRTTTRASGQ